MPTDSFIHSFIPPSSSSLTHLKIEQNAQSMNRSIVPTKIVDDHCQRSYCRKERQKAKPSKKPRQPTTDSERARPTGMREQNQGGRSTNGSATPIQDGGHASASGAATRMCIGRHHHHTPRYSQLYRQCALDVRRSPTIQIYSILNMKNNEVVIHARPFFRLDYGTFVCAFCPCNSATVSSDCASLRAPGRRRAVACSRSRSSGVQYQRNGTTGSADAGKVEQGRLNGLSDAERHLADDDNLHDNISYCLFLLLL